MVETVLSRSQSIRFHPRAWAEVLRRRLWSRLELCFYARATADLHRLPRPRRLRRDAVDDLHSYRRLEPDQLEPDDFRRECDRRLAAGFHLYTSVRDGTLEYYGWLVDRQPRSEDPLMGQVFFPPAEASVIFDCFVDPRARGRGIYYQALCEMMHEAKDTTGAACVCMAAFSDNAVSRHVIEKVGFRYIGSFVKERRLLTVKRFAVAAAPEFRTALL